MTRVTVLAVLALSAASSVFADTAIETETAPIGAEGDIGIRQSFKYEKAKDSTAQETPTQFEYGISDRSELLI